MTAYRRAPQSQGQQCSLLRAADSQPRRACDLRRRASPPISEGAVQTSIDRLTRVGSLARQFLRGVPHYTLTPSGEAHLRVLETGLSFALAQALLTLTREPQAARLLVHLHAASWGCSRYAAYGRYRGLAALDLAEGSGERWTLDYALTELGEVALSDARLVVAFLASHQAATRPHGQGYTHMSAGA